VIDMDESAAVIAEKLRNISPEALMRLAVSHKINCRGKGKEALIAEILKVTRIEAPPAPPVSPPVHAVAEWKATHKYAAIESPGKPAVATWVRTPKVAPVATKEKVPVAVLAPSKRHAFLTGPNEVPEAVSGATAVPKVTPTTVPASPTSPPTHHHSPRRAWKKAAPTLVVAPVTPASKAAPKTPPKWGPVAKHEAPTPARKYAFLLGPGEVPEKES